MEATKKAHEHFHPLRGFLFAAATSAADAAAAAFCNVVIELLLMWLREWGEAGEGEVLLLLDLLAFDVREDHRVVAAVLIDDLRTAPPLLLVLPCACACRDGSCV